MGLLVSELGPGFEAQGGTSSPLQTVRAHVHDVHACLRVRVPCMHGGMDGWTNAWMGDCIRFGMHRGCARLYGHT